MRWRDLSIKIRLIVICLLLATIPAIITGSIIYRNVSKNIYVEIEEKVLSGVHSYRLITESTFKQIENQKKSTDEQALSIINVHASYIYDIIQNNKTNLEGLTNRLASMQIGKTGYVYVLDYKGNYIVSKNRERDGENIWDSKDDSGNYFIQDITNKGKTLEGKKIDYSRYFWKNIGDEKAREKLVGIIHEPGLGWIVGIGTYFDELLDLEFENRTLEDLKEKIKNVKVGKTGYMFVINSKGNFVIHPDKAMEGKNYANLDFIQQIIKEKNGYIQYIWEGKDKVAGFTYYEPKDWIIASSSYKSDFMGMIINIRYTIFFICLIVILIGTIVAYRFALSIANPLREVVNIAKNISDGYLDVNKVNINSKDEIGELIGSFNKMIESLKFKLNIIKKIADGAGDFTIKVELASDKDIFGKTLAKMLVSLNDIMWQVNNSVEQVSTGSDQVAQASQSLSQGATEQASSLEEITSSITEITSQVKLNANSAVQANGLAKKAMENAEDGNKQMDELVVAMLDINKSADSIKQIVKVIDDIAFQTNLLALNANVEAARAGKYGKGFAVVAEEVRNLAGRSAISVKETTEMVDTAIKNIDNGNKLVVITAKQLNEIMGGANKVADLVEEIATASKEQAIGLDQINQGLGQIDQVTQSNTASAEESASAAEELAGQAQQLKAIVTRFKLNDSNKKELIDNNKIEDEQIIIFSNTPKKSPKEIIKLDDKDFGKF